MKIKNIIYDLDGVLLNSIKLMEKAWNYSCTINNINIPFNFFKKHLGNPMIKVLDILDIDKQKQKKIKKNFEDYSILNYNQTKLFNNVKNTLIYINSKKINQFIVTSKNIDLTTKILTKKKIINYFSMIVTPDLVGSNFGKPHPKSFSILSDKFKLQKEDSLFIGDSDIDNKFANNSKINFLFAEWGYGFNIDNSKSIKKITDLKKLL